jgi:hypothetical protein
VVWDDDGVAIYFFQRGSIPSDLIAEAPQPSQWGSAMAFWPKSSCNSDQFFFNHHLIFDTTLWYAHNLWHICDDTDFHYAAVIGLVESGPPAEFLVRSRAVRSALVSPLVKIMYETTELRSIMHVSGYPASPH